MTAQNTIRVNKTVKSNWVELFGTEVARLTVSDDVYIHHIYDVVTYGECCTSNHGNNSRVEVLVQHLQPTHRGPIRYVRIIEWVKSIVSKLSNQLSDLYGKPSPTALLLGITRIWEPRELMWLSTALYCSWCNQIQWDMNVSRPKASMSVSEHIIHFYKYMY